MPDHNRVPDSLIELKRKLRAFAQARDWGRFHTPKNLTIALSVEVSELLELFQWLTDEEANTIRDRDEEMDRVQDELADVFIYLVRLADILDVDLLRAASMKVAENELKYPADISKGFATKYTRRRE